MEDNVVFGTFGHAFYGDSGIWFLFLNIKFGHRNINTNTWHFYNHTFYAESGSAGLELLHNLGLGVGLVSCRLLTLLYLGLVS